MDLAPTIAYLVVMNISTLAYGKARQREGPVRQAVSNRVGIRKELCRAAEKAPRIVDLSDGRQHTYPVPWG